MAVGVFLPWVENTNQITSTSSLHTGLEQHGLLLLVLCLAMAACGLALVKGVWEMKTKLMLLGLAALSDLLLVIDASLPVGRLVDPGHSPVSSSLQLALLIEVVAAVVVTLAAVRLVANVAR